MKVKKVFIDYIYITVGTLLLALAVNSFLLPSKISSGGISTIGTILIYLLGIPLSVTNLFFNALLFLAGYKYLGRAAVSKTIVGIVFLSFFLEITSDLYTYKGDMMISCLAGGFLMGAGIGLSVRADGSTGGSDFAGVIIKKFMPHLSVPVIIFFIDMCIITLSGIIFKSVTVTLYSVVSLLVAAKISDSVLYMGNAAKALHIISDKGDVISNKIIEDFGRGVTGIYSTGMYYKKDKLMLFCVVVPREIPAILRLIHSIDPCAFVVINDTKEVLGKGFNNLIK